ncbi:head-tail connector protein [Leuconostoc mesenteroides]|uniref:head-tail connector protein n=1 Tax=Leuconostoc mesenteroides TaxID=1245 RepID=UPI002362F05E|nr:head-tail connector protein [Leuconostoc mesenteroides]
MAIITPQELQDKLNIDDDENELKTLKSLIGGATAMIKASIQMKITDDDILAVDAELYNRLIKTLATSMYYDRELSNGYSTGVRIMLTNLRSEIVGATNA